MSNLVINAVQHSPPQAVVTVRVRAEPGNPALAIIEVEDSSGGIAAQDLPYVFDRFFRADDSRSRDTGGAGLGLAICRSIAEAVGGEITLRSAVSGNLGASRLHTCLSLFIESKATQDSPGMET